MINCLKCGSKLMLNIDLNELNGKCSKCSKKYDIKLDSQNLIITSGRKKLNFFIKQSCKTDKGFSKKIVYDLYNKGYFSCIKVLNQYEENKSSFIIDVNKLNEEKVINDYNKTILETSEKIKYLNSLQNSYYCKVCDLIVDFENAMNNNFSCNICSNKLNVFTNKKDIEKLMNKKKELFIKVKENINWC